MFQKYLKYKKKYLNLKKQIGGEVIYKYKEGDEDKYCIINKKHTVKVKKK